MCLQPLFGEGIKWSGSREAVRAEAPSVSGFCFCFVASFGNERRCGGAGLERKAVCLVKSFQESKRVECMHGLFLYSQVLHIIVCSADKVRHTLLPVTS